MDGKVACPQCSALILPSTAQKNGGLCAPCARGTRQEMEENQARRAQAQLESQLPPGKHWAWLSEQVYRTPAGYGGLSEPNRLFFAASLVIQEVPDGGFEQYFCGYAADHYADALKGLTDMGAHESQRLLEEAKRIIFGAHEVPAGYNERFGFIDALGPLPEDQEEVLRELFMRFTENADNLKRNTEAFAQGHGLRDGF